MLPPPPPPPPPHKVFARPFGVGAPIDPELTADAEEKGDVGPLGAGTGTSLHRQSPPRAPAPGGRQAQRRRAPAAQELPLASAAE